MGVRVREFVFKEYLLSLDMFLIDSAIIIVKQNRRIEESSFAVYRTNHWTCFYQNTKGIILIGSVWFS